MRVRIPAAVLLAVVCALRPTPSFAQIEEVKIGVDGMTCNLCAAGLERSLKRVDGVSGVRISMEEHSATVRMKPGASFEPDKFRDAAQRAGQQAREFELRLSGAVQRQGARYTMQPGGTTRGLALRSAPAKKLDPLVGKVVRARAKVHWSPSSPLELELTEVIDAR